MQAMNYSLELLPDEPILVIHYHEGFSQSKDAAKVAADLKAVLDAQTEPTIMVHVGFPTRMGLDDLIQASNLATNMTGVFRHPNVKLIISVTKDVMLNLAARGLRSPVFGNINMETYPTFDEAMARAHEVALTPA